MKIKILFVISSLSFGGAEKQTVALINKLDRVKFDLSVTYIFDQKDLLSEITGELSNTISLGKKNKFDVSVITKLAKTINSVQPNIIVCVNPYPLLCVRAASIMSFCGAKVITVLHSTRMGSRYNRLIIKMFYRYLINGCDKIVYVSKNQMDYWLDYQGIQKGKSIVIYNGIDTDYFSQSSGYDEREVRKNLGFNKDDFVIVICATFRKVKQHSVLINAVSQLRIKNIPVKLLLVGDGAEKDFILRSIQKVKMEEDITLVGFQKDVRPFISAADVFALVSSTETFSMAILEAMSLGKAIVASKVGGTSEQIEDNINGFLFEPGNETELAEKMYDIYSSRKYKQMGKASKEKVNSFFSEKTMLEKYEDLFTKLNLITP